MTTGPILPDLPPPPAYREEWGGSVVAVGDVRAYVEAARQSAVNAALEWAAQQAENVEPGDGSHDYNAGAETASERIATAIRAAIKESDHG